MRDGGRALIRVDGDHMEGDAIKSEAEFDAQ